MKTTSDKFVHLANLPAIAALTAYDFPTAKLIDEAGVDLILVGDSLGMVVAGLENTTGVTMDHMLYHTEMVARAVDHALLVSDLPYQTYRSEEETVANAQRLIEAGAEAVKLEGGVAVSSQLGALAEANIPFLGHAGVLPQAILEEGGYRKKGKEASEAEALLEDAHCIEEKGAFAIVLEGIVTTVASHITERLQIPTIGIGSGSHSCRGEIAVLHDLVGGFPWFVPPFATARASIAEDIKRATQEYLQAVRQETTRS